MLTDTTSDSWLVKKPTVEPGEFPVGTIVQKILLDHVAMTTTMTGKILCQM